MSIFFCFETRNSFRFQKITTNFAIAVMAPLGNASPGGKLSEIKNDELELGKGLA